MKSFLPLIRREWRLLLFGFLMMFASSPGQTYFISLFGGEIRAELDLTHGEFGGFYSLATLISAGILLWSGTLIDKINLRVFSVGVTLGLVVGCLLLAVSYQQWWLLIALLFLRHFGQGLMYMTSTTTVVRYLDHDKGKANALGGMGYSVSEAILPTIIIGLMLWVGWRTSWIIWAALVLLLIPVILHLLKDHNQRHSDYLIRTENEALEAANNPERTPRRKQYTRAEMLRDPLFYLFAPGLMSQPLLFTGFMFHQIYIIEQKEWSLEFWGAIYVLYALVSVGAKLMSGVLIDHFGSVRMLPWINIPMFIAMLALSQSNETWVAVIFMIGVGFNVGISGVIAAPFFADKYGTLHIGAIKSLATALMVFMSALSPMALGWMIDGGATIEALAAGAAIYVVLTSSLSYYAYRLSLKEGSYENV